jgi:hypothetical protein
MVLYFVGYLFYARSFFSLLEPLLANFFYKFLMLQSFLYEFLALFSHIFHGIILLRYLALTYFLIRLPAQQITQMASRYKSTKYIASFFRCSPSAQKRLLLFSHFVRHSLYFLIPFAFSPSPSRPAAISDLAPSPRDADLRSNKDDSTPFKSETIPNILDDPNINVFNRHRYGSSTATVTNGNGQPKASSQIHTFDDFNTRMYN